MDEDFATFFDDNVSKIQASMPLLPRHNASEKPFPEPAALSSFKEFEPLTPKQVLELINKSPIKSCPLDPVPADIFKSCLPALLPVLTSIVNLSLQTGVFPTQLKQVQLSPIIKKHNLDP